MPTKSSFSNITAKRILGFEDFGKRMLTYMKTSHEAAVTARWDVDGVFQTKLTLASGGNDTVAVGGTSLATEGKGHIFDINQLVTAETDVVFENLVATDYEVGFAYSEVPAGISVNPRTGLPEYIEIFEQVGDLADPDLVVDNGNGTITLRVNSVTEAAVTNAGRLVKVFMKTPASGAASEAIAIETLTVAFTASNNEITTVGSLGQASISTTASDYSVALVGMSVKKASNSIEGSADHFFLGKVTGGGAGSPPSSFDTANQRVFDTFNAATQVSFTPYLYLAATNVQDVIQELVDDLAKVAGGDNGALRIGFVDGGTGTALTNIGGGGFGSVASGDLSAVVSLSQILPTIDASLVKRRSHSAVIANVRPGDFSTLAPVVDGTLAQGGTFFVQRTATSYLMPQGSTSGAHRSMTLGNAPYVIGEEAGSGVNCWNEYTQINRTEPDAMQLYGTWKRFYFTMPDTSNGYVLGHSTLSHGNAQLEDCGADAGALYIHGNDSGNTAPIRVKGLVVMPNGNKGTGGFNETGLSVSGGESIAHMILEAMRIEGPDAAQVTPEAALDMNDITDVSSGPEGALSVVVVKDSIIRSRNITVPALRMGGDSQGMLFDNCIFEGAAGVDAGNAGALQLVGNGSSVSATFRDCKFLSSGGSVAAVKGGQFIFERCVFLPGTDTTDADPQILSVTTETEDILPDGFHGRPTIFRDCTIYLTSGAVRDTGSPTNALIDFGSTGAGTNTNYRNNIIVENLTIINRAAANKVHRNTILCLRSSRGNTTESFTKPNIYRNITLDMGGQYPDSDAFGGQTSQEGLVEVIGAHPLNAFEGETGGQTIVENLSIVNYELPIANHTRNWLVIEEGIVKGLEISNSNVGGDQAGSINAFVSLTRTGSSLYDFVLSDLSTGSTGDPFSAIILGASHSVVENVIIHSMRMYGGNTTPPVIAFHQADIKSFQTLRNVRFVTGNEPAAGADRRIVDFGETKESVVDNVYYYAGSSRVEPIIQSDQIQNRVINCQLRTDDSAVGIRMTGDFCMVNNNHVFALSTIPTITNSGASSVTVGNLLHG